MRRIGKGFSRRITPLFLTIVVQSQLGKGLAMPTDPHHTPTILQSSSPQPQKTHKRKKPKRKDTLVPQLSVPTESITDKAVYKELDDKLVRAATIASSLEAEQDNGNLNKTQSKAKPNESCSQSTSLGGGPRVTDLEKTKTTQANEIDCLKKRVKKLEKRNKSRTHKLKRLYKVGPTARVESSDNEKSLGEDASKQERRIDDIDADEDITLENGKGILVEEHVKPKNKDQVRLDEEAALKLQAEFDEEQRLEREKDEKELEANIALIETWDDVQAKIDVYYQLAERLQAEEQQKLTDEEKATLFMQFLEKRRNFFAAKRAEEKRNKPPTQAQKRNIMCT
nr:hypothetical protein [Tanacetum cinerariifolium]